MLNTFCLIYQFWFVVNAAHLYMKCMFISIQASNEIERAFYNELMARTWKAINFFYEHIYSSVCVISLENVVLMTVDKTPFKCPLTLFPLR